MCKILTGREGNEVSWKVLLAAESGTGGQRRHKMFLTFDVDRSIVSRGLHYSAKEYWYICDITLSEDGIMLSSLSVKSYTLASAVSSPGIAQCDEMSYSPSERSRLCKRKARQCQHKVLSSS